jgi:hypothetical protein
MYDPNLGGNVLFLTIFALLIPAQLLLGYHYRTTGFTGQITYTHPSYYLSFPNIKLSGKTY